ncbi:DUF6123 family protein [Cytobacillus dafuensis]|uniref:Uncharacterized protein n=1 Tax=Cytobacillus dafuensis TaxID=1742359 RepID=A0A5B8Z5N4_CYTDA|nr:DUF6123 family protein [Cytobacillus dafuensis]QED48365.1 hypothetical protein FSZ17_14575 [Cytobacillus dafuensis]
MFVNNVDEYISFLQSKGFQLQEDAIGFINFGKQYTNASDELTNIAIELTLKAQKSFDGSFFVSLLEMLVANKIQNRPEAIQFVKEKNLISI